MLSDLLNLLIAAVIFGGLLYLFSLAPIDEAVKKIVRVIVIIVAIIWALRWLIGHAGGL